MKNIQKNKPEITLSKQVLYFLAEALGQGINWYLGMLPRNLSRKVYGSPESWAVEERFQQERRIKRAIYELKQRKFIKTRSVGSRIFYELTDKGKNETLFTKVKFKKTLKKGYCLVCFDIPEAARLTRWALRRFLKIAGFKLLQKSVWYSNKDIFEEIKEYIKTLQAGRWVTVIKVTSLDFF